jgi:hypothetical protein
MSALEEFMRWCSKERTKIRRQLADYESGKISQRQGTQGEAWVDRTDQEIRRLKRKLADLDAVLKRLNN